MMSDVCALKRELFECIDDIDLIGSFATFDVIENFVNPGISIEPIGIVDYHCRKLMLKLSLWKGIDFLSAREQKLC